MAAACPLTLSTKTSRHKFCLREFPRSFSASRSRVSCELGACNYIGAVLKLSPADIHVWRASLPR